MQARYRSSGDGFRLSSGYRNSHRGGFSRPHPKPYPSIQPPRKAEIFMEAGRLAAEYLGSKGLLPPNLLPRKGANGRFQEFKVEDREPPMPMPMPMPEGRTSALARLGNPGADVGHGRRRYDDEYYHLGSRRGRRRNGPYSRGYGSEWGSRENGRRGPWMERARGYPDTVEEEEDFAPRYPRVRRGGFDEVGSSVSRVCSDERHSISEVTGESGTEVDTHEMADDTGSKMSSSNTRKEPLADVDVDVNKVGDDVRVLNSEAGDEGKSDVSGDLKKRSMQEEDVDVQPCGVDGDPVNKHGDLLKLCGFAKVPTKPRSSVAQGSPKGNQGPVGEASNKFEVAAVGVSKVAEVESVKGSSSTLIDQPMEEPMDPQHEPSECPPGFGTLRMPVDVRDEDSFAHVDNMEVIETHTVSSLPNASQENEYSLQDSGAKKSSPCIERLSTDVKMVEAVDQENSVGAVSILLSNVEPEFNVKLEEEKQLLPTSFDLNLMGTPEITEFPDDPVLDHLHTSAPIPKNGKELLVDVGLSIGNNINGADDYSHLSGDDKVVPVINLEDDSLTEGNACDPSKLKDETMYQSLDNFLSQTDHADLGGIQDGYSLTFSEFLGTDISGCSSVTAGLDNLQTEMNLHGAQGVPGDDDSIYVSLEEIPIGYMGVWDQPTQDYGKLF